MTLVSVLEERIIEIWKPDYVRFELAGHPWQRRNVIQNEIETDFGCG
jgi:hypothetical protein